MGDGSDGTLLRCVAVEVGKGVGNKMKILSLLGCIIMWMPFSFAYTLDDVFKFPEWKTDYGWHYYMNERIRPYSVIICLLYTSPSPRDS